MVTICDMEAIKVQLLRNAGVQPSSDVIAKALGEANDAYVKFIKELANHDIQLEWRYYTDGKAWLAKGLYSRLFRYTVSSCFICSILDKKTNKGGLKVFRTGDKK